MKRWLILALLPWLGTPLFAQELAFDTMGNLYVRGQFEVPNDSTIDYMDLMMHALKPERATYNNSYWRFKQVRSVGKVILPIEDFVIVGSNWQGKLIFKLELHLEEFNDSDEPYGKPVNLFKWETRRFELLLYKEADHFDVKRHRYRKLSENDQATLRTLAKIASQAFVKRVHQRMNDLIA